MSLIEIGPDIGSGGAYGEVYIEPPGVTISTPYIVEATAGEFDTYGHVTLSEGKLLIGPNGGGLYEVHFSMSFDSMDWLETARLNVNDSEYCQIANGGSSCNVSDTGFLAASGLFRFNANDLAVIEIFWNNPIDLHNFHFWIRRKAV